MKRKRVKIISFALTALVALAAWGAGNTARLAQAKRSLASSNERSLTQLGTYLDDIALNMEKCRYVSSSPMMADISSRVWRSSAAAKTSLAQLTDSANDSSSVYKFLSQVGEYTYTLNKKMARGDELSDEETENIRLLGESAQKISADVDRLIQSRADGTLDFERVKSTLEDAGEVKDVFSDGMTNVSQIVKDSPSLIYDGPFSDNIGTKESEILSLLEDITADEAKEQCAEFLDTDTRGLYFLGETHSNIDTYTFYNTEKTVSVTKKGGLVNYMLSSRFVGEAKLKPENAVKKATEFLNRHGYNEIKESYYAVNDGVCTVNFSYFSGGVTYYTDLIKVGVALDNGEVVTFDATGYIMNHRDRGQLPQAKYSLEECAGFIRDDLTVKNSKKAYIPSEFETEYYVYEYLCKSDDGTEVLVYLDPQTGEERNLLILLYLDNGVLTK